MNPDCEDSEQRRFWYKDVPTKTCSTCEGEAPIEYAYVDTCLDTGKIINRYCPPDRVKLHKKYIKGEEPTVACGFHKKPDPPIPEPCKPYLGAGLYDLRRFSDEQIEAVIKKLHEAGGNALELFLIWGWPLAKRKPWHSYPSSGWRFTPYKLLPDEFWSEPKFGDYKFPMFDLDTWNNETWDKYRLIFSLCEKYGIAVFLRIEDFCSLKDPFYNRHNPHSKGSNVQSYHGGTWGEGIWPWNMRLNRKIIKTVNEAELKHIFYVKMNEADILLGENDTEEWGDKTLIEYHQRFVDDFLSLGVKKEQMIMNIHRDKPRKHFENLGYMIEWHWIASPESMKKRYADSGINIFCNGDGAKDGLGGTSFAGYTQPSFLQGEKMGRYQAEIDGFGYSSLIHKYEQGPESNIDLVDFNFIKGMKKGIG